MPTTGSLSRTAVNLTSGVRTPAGGLVTGVMVLLALAFLTPAFTLVLGSKAVVVKANSVSLGMWQMLQFLLLSLMLA